MTTPPGRLERWAVRRGTTTGALTLRGPGVRVERGRGSIAIEQRRSATHVVIALVLVAGPVGVAALVWGGASAAGRAGLAALVLACAGLAVAVLTARIRYAVDGARLREERASLRGARVLEWPLAAPPGVRIVRFPHEQTWTAHQVQIAVASGGWVPIAESLDGEESAAFARDLAEVAGAAAVEAA